MYVLKCDVNSSSCWFIPEANSDPTFELFLVKLYMIFVVAIVCILACSRSPPQVVVHRFDHAAPNKEVDHHMLDDKPSDCKN